MRTGARLCAGPAGDEPEVAAANKRARSGSFSPMVSSVSKPTSRLIEQHLDELTFLFEHLRIEGPWQGRKANP